jgi:hypothetical protein
MAYGFLTPACRHKFQALRAALALHKEIGYAIDKIEKLNNNPQQLPAEPKYLAKCPKCKVGYMVVILHLFSKKRTFYNPRSPP